MAKGAAVPAAQALHKHLDVRPPLFARLSCVNRLARLTRNMLQGPRHVVHGIGGRPLRPDILRHGHHPPRAGPQDRQCSSERAAPPLTASIADVQPLPALQNGVPSHAGELVRPQAVLPLHMLPGGGVHGVPLPHLLPESGCQGDVYGVLLVACVFLRIATLPLCSRLFLYMRVLRCFLR